jgi:hypothetical protein
MVKETHGIEDSHNLEPLLCALFQSMNVVGGDPPSFPLPPPKFWGLFWSFLGTFGDLPMGIALGGMDGWMDVLVCKQL